MQITETVSEGLRREYKIVVAAWATSTQTPHRPHRGDEAAHAPQGLPPGQGAGLVPEEDLRQVDDGRDRRGGGQRVQPEGDHGQRAEARVRRRRSISSSELEQVVDGKSDLEFTVKVDLMPDFELADVSKLKVEKLSPT